MENYSYSSYPDSGNSSPQSREIDFDNPPPWDDQQQLNYKVKFMCSYGGKIQPRPHDNQLSYIGGETKILAIDRNIKFSSMITKLSALCGDSDVAFKYQLPGEDLDALISVTNDDDLDHLMHEYDRLYRSSAKPARMRLFLFPANPPPQSGSFVSGQTGSDRDRFVEALNSVPAPDPPKPAPGNVDFLFGLEKGGAAPPAPAPAVVPDPVQNLAAPGREDRGFGTDGVNPAEIQRQLQELQRLQISGHVPEAMYRRKSDDNMGGGFAGSDYYVQKMPERATPVTIPGPVPPPVTGPTGYWSDKQIHSGAFSAPVNNAPAPTEQPMYVIHGHGGVYHAPPMIRPVSSQPSHGYYAVHHRVPSEVYNVAPQPSQPQPPPPPQLSMAAPPGNPPQQQMQKVVEPMGATRPGVSMVPDGVAYQTVGYDGRQQVFYTAGGGVVGPPPQYQGMAAVTADMRQVGAVLGQEGKVVTKVSQASV